MARTVLLCVLLGLICACGVAEKADEPVFSEMKSKLFKNLASLLMNGKDPPHGKLFEDVDGPLPKVPKLEEDNEPVDKAKVAKVAQAAAQQQAYYDAYMFNMMRFREAQAAAVMRHRLRQRMRHKHKKKGAKGAVHNKHKRRHRHRMRFQQMFSPFPMMTPQSYYQQYYSHPRFRQMNGMGMPTMGMPGMMPGMAGGAWPDPAHEAFGDVEQDGHKRHKHKRHVDEDEDMDEDEDEDGDEDEDSDADKKEASKARFREVMSHKSPVGYGDPLNSPSASTAPRVQTPDRVGGLGGAYGPPAAAPGVATAVAHPVMGRPHPNTLAASAGAANANAYAAMRFRSRNAPAATGKPNGDPNPTGVPMPMYAPTQPPPPAPNQVPAPASMIGNQIFPHNMQMANGRKYMPQNPIISTQQKSFMPQGTNPTTATGQYPFQSSFLQVDQQVEELDKLQTLAEHPQAPVDWYNIPRGHVAQAETEPVHARLTALAHHPHRMHMRAPLLKEHTEEFPLL